MKARVRVPSAGPVIATGDEGAVDQQKSTDFSSVRDIVTIFAYMSCQHNQI